MGWKTHCTPSRNREGSACPAGCPDQRVRWVRHSRHIGPRWLFLDAGIVDYPPVAVGLAAGGAVCLFGATADGEGLLVFAAVLSRRFLIGSNRRDFAVIATVRVGPARLLARRLVFETVRRGLLGKQSIGAVKRLAHSAAKKCARDSADGDGGELAAPVANLGAGKPAEGRTEQRTASFLRAMGARTGTEGGGGHRLLGIDRVVGSLWD